MAEKTVIIGDQWKGIGNTWVDDQPGYCVDSLNVLADRTGQWLQSRPGFRDTALRYDPLGGTDYKIITGLALFSGMNAHLRAGYAKFKGVGPFVQVTYDDRGTITETLKMTTVANANAIDHPDLSSDTVYSSAGTPNIAYVCDAKHLYMFDGLHNGVAVNDYSGYAGPSATIYQLPFMDWQSERYTRTTKTEVGLYGAHAMDDVDSMSREDFGGSLTPSGTYWVEVQFIVKDKNGVVMAYSTPYHVWSGKRPMSHTLTGTNDTIFINTGYIMSENWKELGWNITSPMRGWFGPTHIRVLRTLANVPDYYFVAEEYEVGQKTYMSWRETAPGSGIWHCDQTEDPGTVYWNGTAMTRDTNPAHTTNPDPGKWAYDAGSTELYFHEDVDHVWSPSVVVTVDKGEVRPTTSMADSELKTEYEDLRGMPSALWLGELHNDRLFAASSPMRVAWRGVGEVWFSLAGNPLVTTPDNYFLLGNGEIPTGMKSLPGQNALLILTDQNAFILAGNSTDTYDLVRIGAGCDCMGHNCCGMYSGSVVWVGKAGLWLYDGSVPRMVSTHFINRYISSLLESPHDWMYGATTDHLFWWSPRYYQSTDRPGLVYDFTSGATWKVDRTVVATKNIANTRYYYTGSYTWGVGFVGRDTAFCLFSLTDGAEPISTGQFPLSAIRGEDYNHYDTVWSYNGTDVWTPIAMKRTWISPWYTFGSRTPKTVQRIRLVASPNTIAKITVEGSDTYTESTTFGPNARSFQMRNGDEQDFSVSGKYIRVKIEGVSTNELRVRRLEVAYATP